VIRKPTTIHSRARARRQAEAKAKGRHTGYGKHGTQAGSTRQAVSASAQPNTAGRSLLAVAG
jgi:large subunit ribosomal protein L19e